MSEALRLICDDQPASPGTVAWVINAYLAHLAGRVSDGTYKGKSRDNVSRYLADFAVEAGRLPLSEARQFHFTGWLTARASTWSGRTREDAQNYVLTCFNWALDDELIDRCPFRRPKTRYPKPRRPAFDDIYYVRLMWFCMGSRKGRQHKGCIALRRALYFLRNTGARQGEMRNLRKDQVDLVTGACTLQEHKTEHVTGEPRLIGLPAKLVRFLAALMRRSRSEYVFHDAYGQPWTGPKEADNERGKNSFCRLLRRWADRAGLPKKLTAHCLRHASCVRAIERGDIADKAIADQHGWKGTRMVSHYGAGSRINAKHVANVAEKISGRRAKPEKKKPKWDEDLPLFRD